VQGWRQPFQQAYTLPLILSAYGHSDKSGGVVPVNERASMENWASAFAGVTSSDVP